MSKDQKQTKKKNLETVENWKEYFYENFETIELNLNYARNIKFILERVSKHLGKNFPDNLYKNALNSIIQWIDTSIELHYSEKEFLLRNKKNKNEN